MDRPRQRIEYHGKNIILLKLRKIYHILENQKFSSEPFTTEDKNYLDWASKKENKGNILLTKVTPVTFSDKTETPIMKIITPVWQVSVDQSHPVASNNLTLFQKGS